MKNVEYENREEFKFYNWDKKYLFEVSDFTEKLVLDVGSGTGRLAFVAAAKAKRVFAGEPRMRREYLQDKINNI